MIARHCQLALHLAAQLASMLGFDILSELALSQVAIALESDDITTQALDHEQENGKFYPTHDVWRRCQFFRISTSNHATDRSDINVLIHELKTAHHIAKSSP